MNFNFMSMVGNYKDRKVARFNNKKKTLVIDTCAVFDSDQPYETGICDKRYTPNGEWIIVELYNSKEEAKKGHQKWVKLMTAKKPPEFLNDANSCGIGIFSHHSYPLIRKRKKVVA